MITLLVIAVLLMAIVGFFYALLHSGGKRYEGEAPYRGKVVRFKLLSGGEVERTGDQKSTEVK